MINSNVKKTSTNSKKQTNNRAADTDMDTQGRENKQGTGETHE